MAEPIAICCIAAWKKASSIAAKRKHSWRDLTATKVLSAPKLRARENIKWRHTVVYGSLKVHVGFF
jgi:hypothetical protein